MPKKAILTPSEHSKLVKDIRTLIEEGRARAVKAANQELLKTYWLVGKRLCEEALTENAGYGDAVLDDLSEEIGIDASTLKRCMYFFQTYSCAPSGTNLTWTHYKSLLPIQSEEKRNWYENLAEDKGLTTLQLSKAIKERRWEQTQKSAGKKPSVAAQLNRPAEATYVYKARVERVIDGDTLLLRVDLGFQVWKEQRIRLADIDAPAMDEPGGKEAYTFVLHQLAQVDYVMVKTHKIDIYGRYVGHLFYAQKDFSKEDVFLKGSYLNQELVARGLASIL